MMLDRGTVLKAAAYQPPLNIDFLNQFCNKVYQVRRTQSVIVSIVCSIEEPL